MVNLAWGAPQEEIEYVSGDDREFDAFGGGRDGTDEKREEIGEDLPLDREEVLQRLSLHAETQSDLTRLLEERVATEQETHSLSNELVERLFPDRQLEAVPMDRKVLMQTRSRTCSSNENAPFPKTGALASDFRVNHWQRVREHLGLL
jgi:hypothetical protein